MTILKSVLSRLKWILPKIKLELSRIKLDLPRLKKIDSKAYSYLVRNWYMREAKLRDIMRKYIFVSYENEHNKNKIGITKIKVDISKNNVRNYMDYLLMRKMRLPFIESHLLYNRLPIRQVCFIINISFLIKGNCSFCWYWWNCWRTLFTYFFHSTESFNFFLHQLLVASLRFRYSSFPHTCTFIYTLIMLISIFRISLKIYCSEDICCCSWLIPSLISI
jgi:hypothetical protein